MEYDRHAALKVLCALRQAVCQAALPAHWLDAAPTLEERTARRAALDVLAYRDEHGCKVLPGPETLRLIGTWPVGWR